MGTVPGSRASNALIEVTKSAIEKSVAPAAGMPGDMSC
jgi:hypothetical protein